MEHRFTQEDIDAFDRTICVDFDGVLHSFTQGWTGPMPEDPPIQGAQAFLKQLKDRGYRVVISSCRALDPLGVDGIRQWMEMHGFCMENIRITHIKPPASLYIDDRGFRFEGKFNEVFQFLQGQPKPGTWYNTA